MNLIIPIAQKYKRKLFLMRRGPATAKFANMAHTYS